MNKYSKEEIIEAIRIIENLMKTDGFNQVYADLSNWLYLLNEKENEMTKLVKPTMVNAKWTNVNLNEKFYSRHGGVSNILKIMNFSNENNAYIVVRNKKDGKWVITLSQTASCVVRHLEKQLSDHSHISFPPFIANTWRKRNGELKETFKPEILVYVLHPYAVPPEINKVFNTDNGISEIKKYYNDFIYWDENFKQLTKRYLRDALMKGKLTPKKLDAEKQLKTLYSSAFCSQAHSSYSRKSCKNEYSSILLTKIINELGATKLASPRSAKSIIEVGSKNVHRYYWSMEHWKRCVNSGEMKGKDYINLIESLNGDDIVRTIYKPIGR